MEDKLSELSQYCSRQKLVISPSIRPQHNEASGLGLYIVSPVKKGQQLIYAPTTSLFTTASIPSSFLPSETVRSELSVHGLLAAWLAFGDERILKSRYGPWMSVWPSWPSFRDSMPVFWQPQFLANLDSTEEGPPSRPNKRQRRLPSRAGQQLRGNLDSPASPASPDFSSSPAIEGWLPPYPAPHQKPLTEQVSKLRHIIATIHQNQELLGFDILAQPSRMAYHKFLHMWCCVNSRCFYYIPRGTRAPRDPNEAMALVPFLDLFNHSTDGNGAEVKFDNKGFFVTADRDYVSGEEIFIQYGTHTNDALWTEYGFLLDHNTHDEVSLDQIILDGLSDQQRGALRDAKYLGDYTLSTFGIGHRMETVAWLTSGALDIAKWVELVHGVYHPDVEYEDKYNRLRLMMNTQIIKWLSVAKQSGETNLSILTRMHKFPEQNLHHFMTQTAMLPEDENQDSSARAPVTACRMNWCLKRWKQVYAMCISAMQVIADDCPLAVGKNAEERRKAMSSMYDSA